VIQATKLRELVQQDVVGNVEPQVGARHFESGQFFRVQNFETLSPILGKDPKVPRIRGTRHGARPRSSELVVAVAQCGSGIRSASPVLHRGAAGETGI